MQYELIDIRTINADSPSELGGLSFFESDKSIPFEIKRIYYIHDVKLGGHRGMHAHKTLEQFLFCPYGRIRIVLDDGFSTEDIMLDSPSKGLLLHPCLWREMFWEQDDSVLCVAASEYYDEDDYIRNYDDFKAYISKSL